MEALGRILDLAPGIDPVDVSGGAKTGKRVYLGDASGATLVVYKGVEAGTDDPVLTLNQWTVSSSGSAAAINVDHYYTKAHATAPETTAWTRVSMASGRTVTLTGLAALAGFAVIEFSANSLSDGYKYLSVDTADAGSTAQLAGFMWILHDLEVQRSAANLAKTLR